MQKQTRRSTERVYASEMFMHLRFIREDPPEHKHRKLEWHSFHLILPMLGIAPYRAIGIGLRQRSPRFRVTPLPRICCRTMATFFLDNFAKRQWEDPNHAGSRMTWDQEDFVKRVEEAHRDGAPLREGYAPFCKHIFVQNFTEACVGAERITDENRGALQSAYQRRRPEELAVLARWFPRAAVTPRRATFLDIICYSREQILKEYEAMPSADADPVPDAPWGIISIKAQDEAHETPMQVCY